MTAPADLVGQRPPISDWLERCRRADAQRAREEGFAKGTPVVPDKAKS